MAKRKQEQFDFSALKPLDTDHNPYLESVLPQVPNMQKNGFNPALLKPVETEQQPPKKVRQEPTELAAKLLNPHEGDYPGAGMLGAAMRNARNMMARGALNTIDFLPSLLGHSIRNKNMAMPAGFEPELQDENHPIASMYGNLMGAGAIGGPMASGLFKAVPALGRFAASGTLPSYATSAGVGGVLGGLMGEPEHRGESAAEGSLFGVGGHALHDLFKSIPGGLKWLKEYGTIKGSKQKYEKAQTRLEAAKKAYLPEQEREEQNQLEAQRVYDELVKKYKQEPEIATVDPNIMLRKAEQKKRELAGIQQEQEQIPEEHRVNEAPQTPKLTNMESLNPFEPQLAKAEKLPPTEVSEEPVKQAESLFNTKAQRQAESEQKLGTELLGKGKAHKRRVGQFANKEIEKIQEDIGKEYDAHEKELEDKHVTLESTPQTNEMILDMLERIKKESPHQLPKMDALNKDLKGNQLALPADKIVSAYRTVRKLAQETRASAYGESPQEFDRRIAKANELDADTKQLEDVLDKGLGKDYLKKLHATNKRYATEFAPLYESDTYKYLLKHNTMPANMIEALSKEPFVRANSKKQITGQSILRNIIKSNPEMVHHVLGEQYAKNPSAIHEYNELTSEWLPHASEELHEAVGEHHQAKQETRAAEMAHEQAKFEHKQRKLEAQERDKEAQIAHEEQVKEHNLAAKAEAKAKTQAQKQQTKAENEAKQQAYAQKNKYHENKQKIDKLDGDITRLEEAAKNADEAAKKARKPKSGASLAEVTRLEREARNAKHELLMKEKERKKIMVTMVKLAGTAVSAATGVKIGQKLL